MASKSKLILIIFVAFVGILVIVGVTLFFLMGGEKKEEGTEAIEEVVQLQEHEPEIIEPEFLMYVELKPFTTTIGQEPRYAKISIQFKMGSPESKAFLESRLAEVKDAVISVMNMTDSKDIQQDGWIDRLKKRVIVKINTLYPEEREWTDPKPIRKVLFNELLVQ